MPGWTVRTQEGVSIISLDGAFANYDQVKSLWETLVSLLSSGHKQFVLDLSGISFMNSTSLGGLVSAYTKVRAAGGKLVLTGMNKGGVRDLLEITKLRTVFDVFDSESEAVAALQSGAA